MSKRTVHKILIILLSLVLILLFVTPYGKAFNPGREGTGDEKWESSFIFDDLFPASFYFIFLIVWIICLLLQYGIMKNIFKIIALFLSLLYLVFAVQLLTGIAPDFVPGIGLYLSMLIFPLFYGYVIIDYRIN